MHVKNGIKSTLRMPGRSLLTFLLFFLVTALLAVSLGVTASVSETLKALSDSYTTIAAAEYISEEADAEAIRQAAAEISSLELPESVLRWAPEQMAQCFLSDLEQPVNTKTTAKYGVVVLETRTPGVFSYHDTISASVKTVLFSLKEVEDKQIEVYCPGIAENTPYLVYGKWFTGVLGTAASLTPLIPPLQLSSAEAYETAEGVQEYLDMAELFRVRASSVNAAAPDDIDSYFPFQQKIIQIREGRSFTEEEKTGGKRVCLLPESLAGTLDCGVGDEISLSLAVGSGGDVMESYDPAKGFDLVDSFTVVGILNAKDAWSSTIFLPPQPELDFSGSGGTATVGQFLLDNDRADAFVNWAANNMPTGVRVTVYDQGYEEASRPIRSMLRTVRLITAASVLTALCFLLLNLWLFVSRQKRTGILMHRLGSTDGGVACYFLSALLPILLPALALGSWFSIEAEQRIAERLAEILNRSEQADLRYSDAQLSLRQSVELVQKRASKGLYLLVACGVLLASLLLCWILAARTIPKNRRRHRLIRLRSHTRTRSLNGGAAKYALLAAERGGFRTWVSVLAPLAAAVLFCLLSSASDRTQAQLRDLEENATVRGYSSNVQGTSASGLLLKYADVFSLGDLESTVSLTGTRGDTSKDAYWDYLGKSVNWDDKTLPHAEDLQLPELPTGPYLDEILTGDRRRNGIHLISANSMNDVPALMYSSKNQITWAEEYSDQILQGWRYGLQYGDGMTMIMIGIDSRDDWETQREKVEAEILELLHPWYLYDGMPCVVSASFLRTHGLGLGDSFFLTQLSFSGNEFSQSITARIRLMTAVGCYSESSDDGAIYIPMVDCLIIGPDGQAQRENAYKGPISGVTASGKSISDQMWNNYIRDWKLTSAVYRFKASDLDNLKEQMQELGFTEVGFTGGIRKPFILEDQTFLATKRSVEQRLWYMDRTFPVAVVLTELLALLLSLLLSFSRRRELWLMHLTGTGKGRAFFSILLEQLLLCPIGVLLGLGLSKYLGLYRGDGGKDTLLFAGLWLAGTLTAALMMTLHPKKSGRDE